MSIVLNLSPEIERELQELAITNGQAPGDLAADLVQSQMISRRIAALKDRPIPQILADLKPRQPAPYGSTPLREVIGKWPGDETDEEINAALEEMS